MKRRPQSHARIASALCLLALVLLANVRLHRPGGSDTALAQLAFLTGALSEGAAERMQQWFPEGYVFTWALYGAASAQAARDPDLSAERQRLLEQARAAVRAVRTDDARAAFSSSLNPPRGAFYASWSLYVLAEYVRAAGPENVAFAELELFREEAAAFAAAIAASDTPFLDSYPGSAWPADTAVGVGALGIFNQVVGPEFESVVESWVTAARASLDPELGALTHSAFSEPRFDDDVRGSSLALMSRVLVDADPVFAREQYRILRERFVGYRFGVPGVREYPRGTEGGGDIDSGPIVLGYSGPAIVVGAAAARAHGDSELERVLLGGVELGGVPIQLGGKRRYAGGVVPVGDAFLVWARTSPAGEGHDWAPVMPKLWFLPFHLVSLLIGALIAWRAGLPRRSKRGPTGGAAHEEVV